MSEQPEIEPEESSFKRMGANIDEWVPNRDLIPADDATHLIEAHTVTMFVLASMLREMGIIETSEQVFILPQTQHFATMLMVSLKSCYGRGAKGTLGPKEGE